MNQKEWEDMKNVDLETVNPDTLKDIRDVKIDTSLPKQERIREFIRQIGNPYCFKCGKTVVKINFADTQETFEDRMKAYIDSLS